MKRAVALLALLVLVPAAAATRDDWFGAGAGQVGVNHCRAAFHVQVHRSAADPGLWDVRIVAASDTDVPPALDCVVPRIRDFPSSIGTEAGQWRQDTSGPCIDRQLSMSAVSISRDAGLVDFSYVYRDRCVHFYDTGRGQVVIGTAQPNLQPILDLIE